MADEKLAARVKRERAEFAAMDAATLAQRLDSEKKALWTLKFTLGKRMLTDTAQIAKTKKTIARLNLYRHRQEAATAAPSTEATH